MTAFNIFQFHFLDITPTCIDFANITARKFDYYNLIEYTAHVRISSKLMSKINTLYKEVTKCAIYLNNSHNSEKHVSKAS